MPVLRALQEQLPVNLSMHHADIPVFGYRTKNEKIFKLTPGMTLLMRPARPYAYLPKAHVLKSAVAACYFRALVRA